MSLESLIHLDKFVPRDYQKQVFKAFEVDGYRRLLIIWGRRAGKDICAFNLMIRQAVVHKGIYYYILPSYSQARKTIWDSITNSGMRFLDYIPPQMVERTNATEMKIVLINGSLIQLLGSDNINSIVGTNPRGIVYSEYALQNEKAWSFLRPVLAANKGWAVFISTPRGKNFFYTMYKVALELPEWHVIKQGVSETRHIDLDILQREREQMSTELFEQEYNVSFERGVEGSIFGKELDRMRLNGNITMVPWEPSMPVYTSFDIGVNDATSIIFFQVTKDQSVIRVIDYIEDNNKGLTDYIKMIQTLPYTYHTHFAPHDLKVREWSDGISRYEKAADLGLQFTILPPMKVADSIDHVRTMIHKIQIDERKAARLINALENYRRRWNEERQIYDEKPLRTWACHGVDAFRYMCQSLTYISESSSSAKYDQARAQALYGGNTVFPHPFNKISEFERYR